MTFAIVSCEDAFETTLEIDPPAYEKQLSIQAFGNTLKKELKVAVTTTVGLFEVQSNQVEMINDATIQLFKNGELVSSIPNGNQFGFNYVLEDIVFETGHEYRLEVQADGFPTATATASLAMPAEITSVTFDEEGISDDFDDDRSEIEVTFNNDGEVNNYYEVGAYIMKNDFPENIYVKSVDPITLEGFSYSDVILDDLSFNGEEKNLLLNIPKITKMAAKDNLYLKWKDISRDQFLFSKTARIQADSEDNPFSTPIQVYSNVNNGVGVFCIANVREIPVEVE